MKHWIIPSILEWVGIIGGIILVIQLIMVTQTEKPDPALVLGLGAAAIALMGIMNSIGSQMRQTQTRRFCQIHGSGLFSKNCQISAHFSNLQGSKPPIGVISKDAIPRIFDNFEAKSNSFRYRFFNQTSIVGAAFGFFSCHSLASRSSALGSRFKVLRRHISKWFGSELWRYFIARYLENIPTLIPKINNQTTTIQILCNSRIKIYGVDSVGF